MYGPAITSTHHGLLVVVDAPPPARCPPHLRAWELVVLLQVTLPPRLRRIHTGRGDVPPAMPSPSAAVARSHCVAAPLCLGARRAAPHCPTTVSLLDPR